MQDWDPRLVAAVVAFGVSLTTLLISEVVKSFSQKRFHEFKLNTEHRYEQRKKLKDILSRNKIQLLNHCESLNHRLWNFSLNYGENWHNVKGNYTDGAHYFESFVYRFASVFSWIKKTEDEMVYLDTTIASPEDMEFIKYLRLLPQLVCDVDLFSGLDYDQVRQKDHVFKDNLELMAQCLVTDKGVCTFAEFRDSIPKYMDELGIACRFIDGMSPTEERLRWDRLQILHLALIAFLNSFGYDFQRTTNAQVKELLGRTRKNRLVPNFVSILERNMLHRQREIKRLVKTIT